jgi:hypothetical protein
MIRKLVSSEFLKNDLQERINKIPDVIRDGERIKVGGIQLMAEFDSTGCNWSPLISSSNAIHFKNEIRVIVESLQDRYNVDY